MLWKYERLYKSSGKFDYQQQYKSILEVAMVSTPEGLTDNSPIAFNTSQMQRIQVHVSLWINFQKCWIPKKKMSVD